MNKNFFENEFSKKSVFETVEPKPKNQIISNRQWLMHLSLKDQILFIKQLAVLIKAGVPLLSSLSIIKEQNKSKTMNKIMVQVINDIENGQSLATALGKFKKIFGELTINIIAVGEASGTLTNNLDHLAMNLKKRQVLRSKLIGASVYPIFIIILTLVITVMLTIFVFPKIIPVFKSVNYQLPWTTRFLIFTNNAAQNYGLLILIIFVLLIISFWFLLKIKKINFWYHQILLFVPLIKRMVLVYNTTNICRTLGLLLDGGVVVVQAFRITANTTINLAYKKELNKIADKLTKGSIISEQISQSRKLFSPIMSQMIAVGEKTGKLSETFLYLAGVYEEEMDDLTKNLSNTIEPLLLIFMGILVGFIAISIITPIYGITQHLTPK